MQMLDEAAILVRLARWAMALARHDINRPSPVPQNPKFMSAATAVRLIGDGAVVAASGLGAHQRAAILYWALRDVFAGTGHPCRLTVVNVGGHGSRGLLPGTLDELARPGLCTRLITSHFETFHAFLELAANAKCQLQCIPLGVMALLFDALRHGKDSLLTDTGVGTFIDPRFGRGSPVYRAKHEPLVSVEGERLRYRMPRIDIALFNAPAADRRGNIYVKNCAMVGDSYELAHAAKRHGGKVIANVGLLVDEGYDRIFLPAKMIDAIVYDPDTEQTAGFFHRDPWQALVAGSSAPIGQALAQARFTRWLGELGGGLSQRGALDEALYRLAAVTLAQHARRGARVAIGAGLPEEVSRVVFEAGRLKDFHFMVESGVCGGLPAPGAYFGGAFSPAEIISTAEFFKRCARRLDVACLGALEVDAHGNVNVSRRGSGIRRYAGPGGFIDFVTDARTLIFISGWMRQGEMSLDDEGVHIGKRGKPKFVRRVSEVTFNGANALRAGKTVLYVTPVGTFRLTTGGMQLTSVMPGIDVRRDILGTTRMHIVLPASGKVPVIDASILTGAGFELPKSGLAPRPKSKTQRPK